MDKIEDCISFLAGKAAQQISRRAKEKLAAHGITPVQYAVLNLLWSQDGQTSTAIGQRLRLDSATMTGVVDRLVRDKILERQSDVDDRRVHRLLLTRTGQRLREPLDCAMDELNDEADKALGSAAVTVKRALRRLADPASWTEK